MNKIYDVQLILVENQSNEKNLWCRNDFKGKSGQWTEFLMWKKCTKKKSQYLNDVLGHHKNYIWKILNDFTT